MTLLEKYADRIAVAEKSYAHNYGAELSRDKKVCLAVTLENEAKFLKEAFDNSVGTQRSDIGKYKRFVMNLTNIALPNLVAFDLVKVVPMTARTGYVTYLEFVAGSNKGGVKQGDLFMDSFSMGEMNEARAAYTSRALVEEAVADGVTAWKPVDGKVEKFGGLDSEGNPIWTEIEVKDIKEKDKIRYHYDNAYIPANDLPVLNARTSHKELFAEPRIINVYYSNLAAYEAKMEMGIDLGAQLDEKAVAELKYEIDSAIVIFLKKMAGAAKFEFNRRIPVGISLAQHYEGFKNTINKMRSEMFRRTQRYSPNYLVCAVDVLEVIGYCNGWKASNATIAGPYLAGTLDGMKVIVSPLMGDGEFFVGVNEGDASAAVYGTYMPLMETSLLGLPDFGMTHSYASMDAIAELNKTLIIAGKVIEAETPEGAVLVANA